MDAQTEHELKPALTNWGSVVPLKVVKIICFLWISWLPRLIVIRLTEVTPWSFRHSNRSASVLFTKSLAEITPLQLFSLQWGVTLAVWYSLQVWVRRIVTCCWVLTLTSISAVRSFLSSNDFPRMPSKNLVIQNTDLRETGLFWSIASITDNRG